MLKAYILEDNKQIIELIEYSKNPNVKGVFVFKHSTRCSVSHMAYKGLQQSWSYGEEAPVFYLDLLKFRNLSNQVEKQFGVKHESPQLLMIKNGECINHTSHIGVNIDTVSNWLN